MVTAELGALELAAAYVPPEYQPDPQLAPESWRDPICTRCVRSAPRRPTPRPQIIASDSAVRTLVDEDLVRLEHGSPWPREPWHAVSKQSTRW